MMETNGRTLCYNPYKIVVLDLLVHGFTDTLGRLVVHIHRSNGLKGHKDVIKSRGIYFSHPR